GVRATIWVVRNVLGHSPPHPDPLPLRGRGSLSSLLASEQVSLLHFPPRCPHLPLPVRPAPNRPLPSGRVRRAARSLFPKPARSFRRWPCRSSRRRGSGLLRSCRRP